MGDVKVCGVSHVSLCGVLCVTICDVSFCDTTSETK